MDSGADSTAAGDYHGNRQSSRNDGENGLAVSCIRRVHHPEVVIEIVTIGGPEGDGLQALQADALRHVLTRLAEQARSREQGEP